MLNGKLSFFFPFPHGLEHLYFVIGSYEEYISDCAPSNVFIASVAITDILSTHLLFTAT